MKIKTSELSGVLLDWAVTKCEVSVRGINANFLMPRVFMHRHGEGDFNYSTQWAQGGRIIEREGIHLAQDQPPGCPPYGWSAWIPLRVGSAYARGTTPLIAAMRCYVTSKLGDEIDVPEELV